MGSWNERHGRLICLAQRVPISFEPLVLPGTAPKMYPAKPGALAQLSVFNPHNNPLE